MNIKDNFEMLKYYRDGILETLQSIDYDRYYKQNISESAILKLIDLVEAYHTTAGLSNDCDMINEAKSLYSKTEKIVKEYNYRKRVIKEGFTNPFDDVDEQKPIQYDDFIDVEPSNNMKISKIKLWNNNTNNKVIYKNGRMIAGQFFGKGDIIELCPVRLIYEKDLYSENIRDFAFTIDRQKGVYAIPFGYASFYRDSKSNGMEPNSDYEYIDDADGSYIKIFAIKNIKRGNEIILYSDESDFANEIKTGQFDYSRNEVPFRSIKNVKIA